MKTHDKRKFFVDKQILQGEGDNGEFETIRSISQPSSTSPCVSFVDPYLINLCL